MLLSVYGSLAYLFSINSLNEIMKNKPALKISPFIMTLYNIYQIMANGYIGYKLYAATQGDVFGLYTLDNVNIRYLVYLHYLTKYIDFIDTLIIVLRKKSSQLSFLHVYHHSTVVVIWDYVVHTWPKNCSAVYMYGAFINSWIHVIMYVYYGVTSLNIKVHSILKKSVTVCQLVQFVSCMMHAVLVLVYDNSPIRFSIVQLMYHVSLFRLFSPLLKKKKQIA